MEGNGSTNGPGTAVAETNTTTGTITTAGTDA